LWKSRTTWRVHSCLDEEDARVDGLEPQSNDVPGNGTAGHLSGKDRAARCPTRRSRRWREQ
jgi:hypothetical protein